MAAGVAVVDRLVVVVVTAAELVQPRMLVMIVGALKVAGRLAVLDAETRVKCLRSS